MLKDHVDYFVDEDYNDAFLSLLILQNIILLSMEMKNFIKRLKILGISLHLV